MTHTGLTYSLSPNASLRDLVSAYVAGLITVRELDEAIAPMAEHLGDFGPTAAADLYGEVELSLAELAAGHLTEEELTRELWGMLGSVVLPMPAPPRFPRPSREATSVTMVVASPDAGTRRVAVHA